jgi:hypothetical protein
MGSLLKFLYFKQDSGLLYRTNYAIDSTIAEILIFGASTANHHYYPKLFEDRMHMSFYNAGRDGNSIFYHYSILQGILKRYSPKIVILDFDMDEFNKAQENYDRISSLLPYYESHPEIRSIIQLKSPYEKYKLVSKIYPFNSLIFTIAIGTLKYNISRKNINDEEGYVPLTKIWKKRIVTDTSTVKFESDSNKINTFKSFIRDCANSNVKLYIVVSPRFIKFKFKSRSIEIANKIANEFNVRFYDFSNKPLFLNNPELFADRLHLNDSGAKIFSNKVIDNILQDQSKNLINLTNNSFK